MSTPGKPSNALAAFMAAAAALPIVALPVSSSAQVLQQEVLPDLLPAGAAVGLRTLQYHETHDRMRVTESMVWVKQPIGENWEVSGSRLLDVVTGASAARVSNQSGKPVQIITGASGESINDRRHGSDVAAKYRFRDTTFSVSRALSNEEDYRSRASSAQAAVDFNDRNTTLVVGIGRSDDQVGSVDNPLLDERRTSREVLLGVTQIIDRYSLLQSNLAQTRSSGYLSDPYRSTLSVYGDGMFPLLVIAPDARPEARTQWAWLTRYKRTLREAGAVLTAEYRYYEDDWGIRGHTVYASWLMTVSDSWKWELGLRYHTQKEAEFYRAEITSRPAPRFTSSDQRLAAFGSLEPSLRAVVQLTAKTMLDVGVSLYRQQGNWRLGNGSPHFEPLEAVQLNAGFVHRF